MALSLQEAFSSLEDSRVERHKRHKLLDIIILTICAVISGAEGWEGIEQFGQEKTGLATKMDRAGEWHPLA
jgi:DDE_Tnp_1-associated